VRRLSSGAWSTLRGAAFAVLDARLRRDDPAPVAVALSGGGDSLALLLVAAQWAQGAGRPLLAITVDHRLREESAAWTRWCAERCRLLGVTHLVRAWPGPAPAAGLAARARAARHQLLAEAAREAGARVILVGHTADDVLEAAAMRQAGATTPGPAAWSPSPAWPQGRELFLLRPLLGLRRQAIRDGLGEIGERWIEDPANVAPHSLRAQVRAAIAQGQAAPAAQTACAPGPPPFDTGRAGELSATVAALADAPAWRARRWLGAAVVCAAGGSRPARAAALNSLLTELAAGAPFARTLGGARLAADGVRLIIAREPADRRGLSPREIALGAGETCVWDGRFEVTARAAGLRLGALNGRTSRLGPTEARLVRALAPCARAALPVLIRPNGSLACPTLAPVVGLTARPLIMARLAAACGAIDHETAIVAWRSETVDPKSAA
jgi:tRNA(Ile)-lysidine synthase